MPVNLVSTRDFRPRALGQLERTFKEKVPLTSDAFETLTREQRARAFRLVAVNKASLIERVQEEIGRALKHGSSLRDMQNKIQELFAEAGLESPAGNYLRLMLRQNMMTTYNVAKKRMGESPPVKNAFPYRMYVTVGDANVRAEHAALNGKVFHKDDPVWNRIFPPWGWGCRCTVRDVTEREAKRLGAAVEKSGQRFLGKKRIKVPEEFDFPRDQTSDRMMLTGLKGKLRTLVEKRFTDAKREIK